MTAALPILYHYDASPFAELVRIAFGIKGLEWGSVMVPNVLPKPDQTLLTGAYARTPVVQIGADIHCDTSAILPAIDALPGPSLYPAPLGPVHRMVASWAAGPQFMAHVGAALGPMPAGAMGDAFIRDRQARFGLDMDALGRAAPHLAGQAEVAWAWMAEILADGRDFIGGDAPGAGDCALYANLWFVRAVPFAAAHAQAFAAHAGVGDWAARMAAIGHSRRRDMTAAQALEIAGAHAPLPVSGGVDAPLAAGMMAAVRQEGTQDAPSTGRLLRCDAGGVTLARETGSGTVHVHFPRLGQIVTPA